jgi:hypothetical protein
LKSTNVSEEYVVSIFTVEEETSLKQLASSSAGFLLGLVFDHEDEDCTSIRKVDELLSDCAALHPKGSNILQSMFLCTEYITECTILKPISP